MGPHRARTAVTRRLGSVAVVPSVSLADASWPLRTERLTIRPGVAADADAVFEYRRLEEVSRWLTTLPTDAEAHATAFVEPGRLASTLILERAGGLIGDLMVRIEAPWAQQEVREQAEGTHAELGWVLRPDASSHGYATEALEAILRVCFMDVGLRRVTANCFADNEPSWRLMERLGMRREVATVEESLHRSGRWLDGYGYALLASEWRATHPG